MFTIYFESFRIESNEERKKRKKKLQSVHVHPGWQRKREGKEKEKERVRTGFFGGRPKPWTRGSPSVATRCAELPRRLASRRRCPTRGGGSVYRVTSSNVRRPRAVAVAVQFPSFLYRATRSRHVTGKNLKDDG